MTLSQVVKIAKKKKPDLTDPLLHRGHLLKFKGKSYRLKEASIRLMENKQKSSG